MSIPMSAAAVLERHFLEMRGRVLEVAASLDRIDRADGAAAVLQDERLEQLRQAIGTLVDGEPDRAGRVQAIFSDPYDPEWNRPAAGTADGRR